MKIISGGQTGADRGALDAAIALGVPHGGWCPLKRRAEDGRIPDKYKLEELPTFGYRQRTRKNVEEADATLIIVQDETGLFDPDGVPSGSEQTRRLAMKLLKPVFVVKLKEARAAASSDILFWLEMCKQLGREIEVLNVAGSRESKAPGIQRRVERVMFELLEMAT